MSHTRSMIQDQLSIPLLCCLCVLTAFLSGPTNAGQGVDSPEYFCTQALAELDGINMRALRMAISDLMQTYPQTYTKGQTYLAALESFAEQRPALRPPAQGEVAAPPVRLGQLHPHRLTAAMRSDAPTSAT